ncbi:FAD-dependent oxidoreductase [Pseudomonas serbica]|uniref:FAD-dependent oxidoreductase n=1 Tax=Pseudomonas serbica TaxID=2965074 RepID=UPI0039E6F5D2
MSKDIRISRRDTLKLGGAALALAATGFNPFAFASDKKSAVVIGAGIAGLSAAYDLKQAGYDVVVMEKWDFIGGRMRDAKMGPLLLMPHALGVLQNTNEIHSLAKEVGIAHEFSGDADADAYVMNNGIGSYPISLKFNLDEISKIPGFTKETVASLPKLQWELEKVKSEIDPSLVATGAAWDHETVGQFFVRVLGKEEAEQFMDSWLDPFLAAWGWTRYETSCVPVIAWMAHGYGTKTPRGGIGVLTRKLGEMLPVSLSTTVRYITPPGKDGRHTIHYLTSELERKSVSPDIVICATEGKFIPELVQGLDKDQLDFFRGIDFTKSVSVRYVLADDAAPKDYIGDAYTKSHPDPIKSRIWFWSVNPKGTDYPENPASISMVLQRSEVAGWQRSGLSQPDYCLPLLKSVYPDLNEAKIDSIVTTGCDDLVHMQPGYVKKIAKILAEQESKKRGLYFIGEYMAGAHTAAACASGRSTARTIIKHWS